MDEKRAMGWEGNEGSIGCAGNVLGQEGHDDGSGGKHSHKGMLDSDSRR